MDIKDPSLWVNRDNTRSVRKHQNERARNGFSTYDWYNFNDYLAWVIIQGLVKFRDEGSGFPAELGGTTETGVEEWNSILNEMITGFEAHLALEAATHLDYDSWDDYLEGCKTQRALRDRGLELFRKHFANLWD